MLLFKDGITAADVTLARQGNNLLITIKDSTDQITVSGHFTDKGSSINALDQIRFADGTSWNTAQIMQMVQGGTDGKDALYGDAQANSLNAGAGDDTLYGYAGDDTLLGEAGNDQIYGGEGNDSLDGGTGNDSLIGGEGNDTLLGGEGNDTLYGEAGSDHQIGRAHV